MKPSVRSAATHIGGPETVVVTVVVAAVALVLDEFVVLLVGVELLLAELAALVVEALLLELPHAASVSAHASTVGESRRLISARLAIAASDPARWPVGDSRSEWRAVRLQRAVPVQRRA
jgi:hypothetical protein